MKINLHIERIWKSRGYKWWLRFFYGQTPQDIKVKNILTKSIFVLFSIMVILVTGCSSQSKQKIAQSVNVNPDSTVNTIKNISIDKQSFTITADRNFKYSLNKLSDPFKFEIELKSVELGRFTERMLLRDSIVSEIVFSKKMVPDEAAILEVTLTAPQKFEHSMSENNLVLKFNIEAESVTGAKSNDEIGDLLSRGEKGAGINEHVEETVLEPQKEATVISVINFKRELEYVKVILKGNGSMMPDVFQLDNRVIIDIPRVNITAKLPQQVPVPIESIKWGDSDGKIRMVIALKEQATFDVIAYGDEIIISLSSPEIVKAGKDVVSTSNLSTFDTGGSENETVKGDLKVYKGKKISLDIQNADIAPILRLFADIGGEKDKPLNVVIDPKVTGKINMKLVNVPWDQALELILKTNGLSQVSEGNI
ncbi:MAG: AMIN domain-containing protein, partial [Nitrospirae bacterium]|nr:AMIN domain-containing protein [Nitrospirota bacterium]